MYSNIKQKKYNPLDISNAVEQMKSLNDILQSGFKLSEKDIELLLQKPDEIHQEKNNNLSQSNNASIEKL
jgi:hypothetical protein